MDQKRFERKKKEDRPVLAICYDFDRTLSPDDMQAQGFIQSVGWDTDAFWQDTDRISEDHKMDQNLAYMLMMVTEAEGNVIMNREALADYGAKVELFPGVRDWFERIRRYGEEKGVIVEHYIISSGLKEMIDGTEMARNGAFTAVYASSFYFNERGVATWPAMVVNYTNKTQFLFRIEKGVLDVNDPGVNEYFPPDQIRVPFRNIVYIGDSDTDIPCMKLVNTYGGHAIAVYNPHTGNRKKAYQMMQENRVKYFAPADYREGTEIEMLLQAIIDRTAGNERLESIHYRMRNEMMNGLGSGEDYQEED
ncbi:MAG: haloacid dehalogenase-like hydrolase [Lachnospiraceae bacterium]|nr:haloacid dehalogenase-like hydrolase [Lachnospiraceae bacterium]